MTLPRRASSHDLAAKDTDRTVSDRDGVLCPVPQRAVPALAPAAVTARARAKLRRLRTTHAARESDRDPRDVRPVAGPTLNRMSDDEDTLDYSEVIFSDSEAAK